MATDQISQQNRTYIASGGIDDDSGTIQRFDDGSSIQTFDDGSTLVIDNEGGVSSTPVPPEYSNAGTTQSGKSDTRSAKNKVPKPGKRLQNPLGNFSSYTYQISLYMITPEAYNTFVQSGRKNIEAFQGVDNTSRGAFLIAQSGGINNSTSKRAPEFDVDFYIDDLKIKSLISGKDTLTATHIEEINFNIYEPYGFSFLTRLRRAMDALNQSPPSNASNASAANGVDAEGRNVGIEVLSEDGTPAQSRRNPETGELYNPAVESATGTPNSSSGGKTSPLSLQVRNPLRQFFILGIRFQGYDKNGNLISSKDQSGYNADPTGNANGVYQRFFDIKISDLKFKIDGRMVVYQCTAVVPAVSEAMGTKRGIIDNGVTIVGGTVNDAFLGETDGNIGMFTKLNNDQKKLKAQGIISIPNEFTITYLGNTNITLGGASIVSPADLDKLKWKMTNAKTTNEVNVKTEKESKAVDNTKRQITIRRGVPILQAIQQIVSQSSFLYAALSKIYTTVEEPTEGEDEEVNSEKNTISWYNVSPELTILGWDDLTGDYAYRINYVIQPYSTPVVNNPYVKETPKYYGPHKRYDYWFTGKNSEILKYEQTFDVAYFTVAINPGESPQSHGGDQQVPTMANKQQNRPKQGALNIGREAQNSYMTSLFEPGAYAEAKISILGDPDYLMPTSASSVQAVYDRFYGPDGYTINPNGGQVFVEINFKEPQDYNKDGLLSINESILFYSYPEQIRKDIDSRGGGVSYQVITVNSNFKGGKFEQELDLVINTFASLSKVPTNPGARPATVDSANQTAATADRTGVVLNSTAGAGRGGRGGPTAAELDAYNVSQGKGFQQSPPITDATGNQTGGGAAFGNPNLIRQGNRARNIQAQQGTKTIPTKTGQVQDDDGGTGTYFAA